MKMNKESEALEALDYFLEKQNSLEKCGSSGGFNIAEQREKLTIIENALKRIPELEKEIEDTHEAYTMAIEKHIKDENEYVEWVQQGGYDKTKVQAFDIIRDKDVNPVDIRCCSTVEGYNNVKEKGNASLTEEEFLVLKMVLGEESPHNFKWRYENIKSRLDYLEKNYNAEIERGTDMDGETLSKTNEMILLNLRNLVVSLKGTLESDKNWWE